FDDSNAHFFFPLLTAHPDHLPYPQFKSLWDGTPIGLGGLGEYAGKCKAQADNPSDEGENLRFCSFSSPKGRHRPN
ncbi:hypothetical protein, partial [Cohnella sp. 56]|uniref:hypothetical protein n=1 Tax=Cohnella sp. 56 TaxID=3113722 RepID=UPI0030EA1966